MRHSEIILFCTILVVSHIRTSTSVEHLFLAGKFNTSCFPVMLSFAVLSLSLKQPTQKPIESQELKLIRVQIWKALTIIMLLWATKAKNLAALQCNGSCLDDHISTRLLYPQDYAEGFLYKKGKVLISFVATKGEKKCFTNKSLSQVTNVDKVK